MSRRRDYDVSKRVESDPSETLLKALNKTYSDFDDALQNIT